MVFLFRMASILLVVRAPCPSHPAAGLLLRRTAQSGPDRSQSVSASFRIPARPHDAGLANAATCGVLGIMPSRARNPRALTPNRSSTADVVLLEQRLVARLVVLLQVVEQRTAGRDQLQEAAAGMVVLAVGLEMAGQVVDAFRQDRNLHLGRTGITGLGGVRLDDFRL